MGTIRKKRRHRNERDSASLDLQPPDGGWGWLVAIGSFIEMFLTMGTLLCSGVYFTPIQLEFEVSSAELGWIISSGSTLLSATCPIGSVCVKRFGCRVTSLIGGLAVSCGFIASSFAQSSIHIFITLGLITGIGSGLVFVSAAVILGHYFKRRYAIVNGLAFSGPGVAIFVLPPVLDYLIETYGWRGSLLIQGAIAMHTVAAAALFKPLISEPRYQSKKHNNPKQKTSKNYNRIEMDAIKNEHQEKHEPELVVDDNSNCDVGDFDSIKNKGDVEDFEGGVEDIEVDDILKLTTEKAIVDTNSSGGLSQCTETEQREEETELDSVQVTEDSILRNDNEETLDQSTDVPNPSVQSKRSRRFSLDRLSFKNNCWLLYTAAFVLICPVSFFQACAFYSVTFHIVARTSLVGVSAHMAGMSLSSLGAGSSFTRLTHGWLIHRGLVTATTAYVIALIIGALGAFGNAISQTYVGVILACLVVGFSSGSVYPLVPVVLRDLVSLRGLPTTYGLAMFFDSCGVFAGGFTAGLLRDFTGTYTASFCMTGVYYSLATVFLLLVLFIMRMHRGRENAEVNTESNKRLESGGYQKV